MQKLGECTNGTNDTNAIQNGMVQCDSENAPKLEYV